MLRVQNVQTFLSLLSSYYNQSVHLYKAKKRALEINLTLQFYSAASNLVFFFHTSNPKESV
jgi:hypothetical protein